MDNDRDIKFDIVIGHHYRSNSAFSKFSRCLPFSKWLPKHAGRCSCAKERKENKENKNNN
jgi:hypothetical protein